MKKFTLVFLALFLVFVISGCGKKDDATTQKDGQNKEVTDKKDSGFDDNSSYTITYQMSQAKGKMNMELFKKGAKIKTIVNSKIDDKVEMKGEGYFQEKTLFMIMDIAGKKVGMKMNTKDFEKDKDKMENSVYDFKDKLKDYTKEGTADVLGYSCDIYKSKEGVKMYIYKGVAMLKMESKGSVMEAVKFEPDAKLDDAMFEIPKDVEFMDLGNLNLEGLKNLKK